MKKLVYALLIASSASIFTAHAHAQAIIIVNPGVKATDVSKGDLKDVFTGAASSLKDGSHVTPVLLKEGPAHEEFLSAYLGKNDTAFRAGWRSLVFSGQASMPKSLESEAAMVDYVAHTPGAIGYVAKSSPHEGVKVLTVK
jgi:ABC-type phosphate transport system substrate-binding protein